MRLPTNAWRRPTGSHSKITGHCQQCHTQKAWKPATFAHEKSFVLDKNHNASCVTCHPGNDYSRYTCYGCHEHTPAKVRSEHVHAVELEASLECRKF